MCPSSTPGACCRPHTQRQLLTHTTRKHPRQGTTQYGGPGDVPRPRKETKIANILARVKNDWLLRVATVPYDGQRKHLHYRECCTTQRSLMSGATARYNKMSRLCTRDGVLQATIVLTTLVQRSTNTRARHNKNALSAVAARGDDSMICLPTSASEFSFILTLGSAVNNYVNSIVVSTLAFQASITGSNPV